MSFITNNIKRVKNALRVRLLPTRVFVQQEFKRKTGYELNLENPRTFNEKIQWLKVNYRNPDYTIMADKVEAKKLIEKKIGKKYVIPTHKVYERANDIFLKDLPNAFALKATHASGWNIIEKDKTKADEKNLRAYFKFYLKKSYYTSSKEWSYKYIKPRVICEELMFDKNGELPKDIKFFCFHGEPVYIQVDHDRFTGHTRAVYNTDWEKQNFSYSKLPVASEVLEKPDNLEEMLHISRALSAEYPFLRVDLYNVDGAIFVGELTCYPGNGMERFAEWEADKKLGDLIHLEKV